MMGNGILGLFGGLWFVFVIGYILVIVYIILLFKRLVEAVERIAARMDRGGPPA
ncbi:MAG: hypothetical protein U0470_07605 [Anaerolineae bacterium]